jgi:integral membrane protein (TIGR01906 family)
MSRRFSVALLTFLVPLVLLGTVIRIEMNSAGLYCRGFEMYSVSDVTGIDDNHLASIPPHLVRYFNGLETSAQMEIPTRDGTELTLFHDYELVHLDDVRKLFSLNSLFQSLGLAAIVLLLASAASSHRHEDKLGALTGLRLGSSLALFGLVALGVLFATQFNRMFVGFHMLAFTNEFWLLDPRTDYLVMLFPTGFWQDVFFLAGGLTGLLALAILIATSVFERKIARQGRPSADTEDV